MTGWIEFIMAMAAFMLSHLLPRVGGLREHLIKRLGRRAYFALYGLVSLVVLGWVCSAAGRGPCGGGRPRAGGGARVRGLAPA